MSSVLPGVADVMARPLRPVSMFMRLDLPTFERPMKAYSGLSCCGHLFMSVLLIMNSALFISFGKGFYATNIVNLSVKKLNLRHR